MATSGRVGAYGATRHHLGSGATPRLLPSIQRPANPVASIVVGRRPARVVGEASLADLSGSSVILIIEDDNSIREIVRRVLEAEGHTVHVASNGQEGLERFYLTLPDLIVLDVIMPKMDGWETLKRLREISDCAVIMLTVFGSSEDIIKGLELGADDYLTKPFGVRELTARVNTVLRRYQNELHPGRHMPPFTGEG